MRPLVHWLGMALLIGLAANAATPVSMATGEYPPYVSTKLPGQGLSSELVSEAMRRMGRPLKLTFLPWKRAFELTRNGLYDASFPYARNPQREAGFLYSAPLHTDQILMFVSIASRDSQVAMLRGKTVCVPDGYDLRQIQGALDLYHMALERPPELADCFRQLNAGRVAGVPINEFVGWDTAREALNRTDRVRVLPESLGKDETYLIAPRSKPQSAAFIADFNRALEHMHQDGSYERIRRRWLPASAKTPGTASPG